MSRHRRPKQKIRQWFKKQERAENIERGRQILEKELRHLGIKIERQELADLFNYNNVDDFLAASVMAASPLIRLS